MESKQFVIDPDNENIIVTIARGSVATIVTLSNDSAEVLYSAMYAPDESDTFVTAQFMAEVYDQVQAEADRLYKEEQTIRKALEDNFKAQRDHKNDTAFLCSFLLALQEDLADVSIDERTYDYQIDQA